MEAELYQRDSWIELGMRTWPTNFQIDTSRWPESLKIAMENQQPLSKTLRMKLMDELYNHITSYTL